MKTRREQRIKILEILYTLDLQGENDFEPTQNAFIDEIIAGVITYQETIDALIQNHLIKYTLKRLSYVDRALLRMATFEMYGTPTPAEIVINEALEIVKLYSDEGDGKMVGFINSVLDKIKIALNK